MTDGQRPVGWVVEETLIKSRREEADGGSAVNQTESQEAADVKVQVVTQSCAHRRQRHQSVFCFIHNNVNKKESR